MIEVFEASIPQGLFQVTKNFNIGFGAWRMTFEKGDILKYSGKTLEQWKDGEWVLRRPPISGENELDLSKYGYEYEQKDELKKFLMGTKKLSPVER